MEVAPVPDQSKRFNVSKLDAAKRQILSAIDMFFHDKDPVSIYTLTAAAYNILRDLNGGQYAMVKDYIMDHIEEGYSKEFVYTNLVNKFENFLKHADRDPDEELDFHPDASLWFLQEACDIYQKLSDSIDVRMQAYRTWFIVEHPMVFSFPPEVADGMPRCKEIIAKRGKSDFYNDLVSNPDLFRIS